MVSLYPSSLAGLRSLQAHRVQAQRCVPFRESDPASGNISFISDGAGSEIDHSHMALANTEQGRKMFALAIHLWGVLPGASTDWRMPISDYLASRGIIQGTTTGGLLAKMRRDQLMQEGESMYPCGCLKSHILLITYIRPPHQVVIIHIGWKGEGKGKIISFPSIFGFATFRPFLLVSFGFVGFCPNGMERARMSRSASQRRGITDRKGSLRL